MRQKMFSLRVKRPWYLFIRNGILLCSLFIASFVQAQQKNITIEFKNELLAEALKKLEKLSSYKILFTYEEVQDYKVTASLKNATILEALGKVLEGKPFIHSDITDGKYISVKYQQSPKVPAGPARTVKGAVLDKNKKPLPGVTVIIKGTTTGVATDADGMYAISIPASTSSPTLVFSFIGMKSVKVPVKNDKPINVTMEEGVNEMEEVVVNGIYTASKNSYTGSVTSISQEEILQVSQTNLFKALTTLVPGMRIVENNEQGSNPNYIPELLIRGTTSIATQGELGLNTPLIIVDGVETTMERLYDMDIFEIERVDVLKDASATAIYGDRAANGVIVVERKKVTDSKLRLRYNFVPDVQFADVSSFDLCNPRQKLELEKRWGIYEDVTGLSEVDYYEKLERINRGVNTDWKSIPLRNSWSHSHSLTATGRGGGLDYSISLRYSNKFGVMKGDYRRNYGIGFYFSYHYKGKLTASLRSDFYKTDTKSSPYGDFSQWVAMNPYDSPYDEYGELIPRLSFDMANPMYNATTNSFSKGKMKEFSNALSLRWDILQGFFVTATGSLSINDYRMDDYVSALHTSSLNNSNVSARGTYTLDGNEGWNWSAQANVTYSHAFDEDGTILTLNFGGSLKQSNLDTYGMVGEGFLKPSMNYISFAQQYLTGSSPSGGNVYKATVSTFGNLNFIWKNRYYMDISYRSSANSALGDNERWTPYWSFGLGWNMHNEKFLKSLGWVSLFRLRGSVGYVGSGNFDGNLTNVIYTYADNYISGLSALPSSLGNPDLKAQRTLSYNAGLTLEILDSRFEVTFDWYKQLSKDLLLPIGIPVSTGASSVQANLGKSENYGYELAISGLIIKNQDWLWRVSANTHHTVNKLKKISNSLMKQTEKNMAAEGIAPKILFKEGESTTAIFAVRSLGINPANGEGIFVRPDGTLTNVYHVEDKVSLGDKTPKLEGSISTALAWKNLSLSMAFEYTLGRYIYNATRAAKVENINIYRNVDVRAFTQRWTKPGDVVAYPRGRLYQRNKVVHSSRFVEKRNELHLSSLNISYNLPVNWVKKLGLKRLAIGVGFSDIFRLSTVKFERGTSYPYMHSYNFMISPTF